jgi:hypothetical protein
LGGLAISGEFKTEQHVVVASDENKKTNNIKELISPLCSVWGLFLITSILLTIIITFYFPLDPLFPQQLFLAVSLAVMLFAFAWNFSKRHELSPKQTDFKEVRKQLKSKARFKFITAFLILVVCLSFYYLIIIPLSSSLLTIFFNAFLGPFNTPLEWELTFALSRIISSAMNIGLLVVYSLFIWNLIGAFAVLGILEQAEHKSRY